MTNRDSAHMYKGVARNIRRFRDAFGYSQEKLARMTGLSRIYISHIETCRRYPSVGVLMKICEAFSVTFSDIADWSDDGSQTTYRPEDV